MAAGDQVLSKSCTVLPPARPAPPRLPRSYIKLGQFIASSPTLFPPEYVLEFQRCLDQTSPVPFEVIRWVGGWVGVGGGGGGGGWGCWQQSSAGPHIPWVF